VVDRWLTRRRLAGTLLSVGMLAACGLGVGFVPIPTQQGAPGKPIRLPDDFAIAAVVAGNGYGYVLGRQGDVLLVGADGSLDHTAVVGPYMTPFGALAGGRAVFGGLRCDGDGCRTRVAEVVTLDAEGRVEAVTAVARSERRPSSLNGLALAGVDGSSPRRFSLSRQARAHSGQRKPPVLRPPLVCGTRCLAQSGCSQFAHLLTAGWPQGFFFSNPVSTVQVSVMRRSVRNCPVHPRAAAYAAARPR
jgi:hypothetical protein